MAMRIRCGLAAALASALLAASAEAADPPASWYANGDETMLSAAFGPPETESYLYLACPKRGGKLEVGVLGTQRRSVQGLNIRITIAGSNFDLPVSVQTPEENSVYYVAHAERDSSLLSALRTARSIGFSLRGAVRTGGITTRGGGRVIAKVLDACFA